MTQLKYIYLKGSYPIGLGIHDYILYLVPHIPTLVPT